MKVESKWTKKINVTPEQNRYYDIHYFFNTIILYISLSKKKLKIYFPVMKKQKDDKKIIKKVL